MCDLCERKDRPARKATFCREVEEQLLILDPAQAGRIDWDTVTYCFNVGKTVAETVYALLPMPKEA